MAGLAGWEDVALLVLGVVLILVEVLVVPGFGVAGVAGVLALLGGAFLAMLHRDLLGTPAATLRAATTVGASFLLMLSGFVVLLWYLGRGHRGGLVLRAGGVPPSDVEAPSAVTTTTRTRTSASRASAPPSPSPGLGGAAGVALSDLRPAGIAEIDGRRIDVVSEGEYIPAGAAVEVVLDEGYRRVVRRRRPNDH